MADREGFEPSVTLLPHTLSKRAHSTTLTPALGGRQARNSFSTWQPPFSILCPISPLSEIQRFGMTSATPSLLISSEPGSFEIRQYPLFSNRVDTRHRVIVNKYLHSTLFVSQLTKINEPPYFRRLLDHPYHRCQHGPRRDTGHLGRCPQHWRHRGGLCEQRTAKLHAGAIFRSVFDPKLTLGCNWHLGFRFGWLLSGQTHVQQYAQLKQHYQFFECKRGL